MRGGVRIFDMEGCYDDHQPFFIMSERQVLIQ